jgi:ATP-dependent helicase YprA (DUF1998 family)
MGIENLRRIFYNNQKFGNKKVFFQRYDGETPHGEDIWDKNVKGYTIKGAYDFYMQNPKGFDFICDEKIEDLLRKEGSKRSSKLEKAA